MTFSSPPHFGKITPPEKCGKMNRNAALMGTACSPDIVQQNQEQDIAVPK
jgi:hypothetical protein